MIARPYTSGHHHRRRDSDEIRIEDARERPQPLLDAASELTV
jgi:hypothetical protein